MLIPFVIIRSILKDGHTSGVGNLGFSGDGQVCLVLEMWFFFLSIDGSNDIYIQ